MDNIIKLDFIAERNATFRQNFRNFLNSKQREPSNEHNCIKIITRPQNKKMTSFTDKTKCKEKNNISDINKLLQNNEKSRTFNKQLYNQKIIISTNTKKLGAPRNEIYQKKNFAQSDYYTHNNKRNSDINSKDKMKNKIHNVNSNKNIFSNKLIDNNYLEQKNKILLNTFNKSSSQTRLNNKPKNINIKINYPMNQIINNNSHPDEFYNIISTESKVKSKNNRLETEKNKKIIKLNEYNEILKTKSNAKIKLENKKDDSDIEIRIIDIMKNDNENNFGNSKKSIQNSNKVKVKKIKEDSGKDNNICIKKKGSNVKVKNNKNNNQSNFQINRMNTYNNDSSFLTMNINCSNIDENGKNEQKNKLENYNFFNNNNNVKKKLIINNLNENIISTKNVYKSNSNTNKKLSFQNFSVLNNFSNCNTGITNNNIIQNNNNNQNINEKDDIILKKCHSNKEELILIELDNDENEPKDNISKKEIATTLSMNKKIMEEIQKKIYQ